jgi:hypothetical protein
MTVQHFDGVDGLTGLPRESHVVAVGPRIARGRRQQPSLLVALGLVSAGAGTEPTGRCGCGQWHLREDRVDHRYAGELASRKPRI